MAEYCAITDIFKVEDGLPSDQRAAIESYLQPFAKPTEECECLKCGERLGGFLGRFTWGLQHGEGFCSNCKWPARAIHYIKAPDGGEDLVRFSYVLQYHPDLVKETRLPVGRNKER